MKNNNEILYGIIGFLLGVLITIFLAKNAVNTNNPQMMGMMGMKTGNIQTGTKQYVMGNIDAHFIEQMIPHHDDAIVMAKLALIKAKKPEVKQLAQNIIESQGKEIIQMKSWYQDWFGKEVPTNGNGMMGKSSGMHGGMMGDVSDVTKLETAVDFDKEFVKEMIPHHQMAVMMAGMLKNGTTRPEMKQLSEDIISAQTEEINQMRSWYKTWGY